MATSSVNNGVNVDALLAAREALKGAPQAAKFTWRASCKWQNGTHSRTKIKEFHGLGEEQKHKTEFSFDADHPVPPAEPAAARSVAILGPKTITGALTCRRFRKAGGVSVSAQRVTHQNDVVTRRRQCSVRLVGDANRMQLASAIEPYRIRKIEELRLDRAGRPGGLS